MNERKSDNAAYLKELLRKAMAGAEIRADEGLDAAVLRGAVVLFSGRMDAIKIIFLIKGLSELREKLLEQLLDACGPCDRCEGAPCDLLEGPIQPEFCIQDAILQEAGIPPDSKLTYMTNGQGGIYISQADHQYDLSDAPDWLIQAFREKKRCLWVLDDLMRTEDTIHVE